MIMELRLYYMDPGSEPGMTVLVKT